MRTLTLLAGAMLCAAASGHVAAFTCYTVLDRNENVIYRDTYPPVDLSDQGAAERQRMRNRGEHLLAMEAERCPGIQFFMGSAGTTTLNVDQVVSGMSVRGMPGTSGVGEATPASSAEPAAPARPAAARPAAPAKR
jgi:hypothetical protein